MEVRIDRKQGRGMSCGLWHI